MNVWRAFVPNGRLPFFERMLVVCIIGVALGIELHYALPAFMPGLLDILAAYRALWMEGLAFELWASFRTNLEALLLSCALSLFLAYASALPAFRALIRSFTKLRFLGFTGLSLLFTLAFGGGHALKIGLLTFGMSVFLLTSTEDLIAGISKDDYDYARTLRMGPWRAFYEVAVLGHLDRVFEAIRQNAAIGWMLLTTVEGLVRFEGGLGAMMLAQDKHLHLDKVMAIQVLVLAVGIAQDALLFGLRLTVCPYADLRREAQ